MYRVPNSRIVTDSRLVKPGDTFVVTKSEGSFFYRSSEDREYTKPYSFDSHPYIADAIANGASLIVYSDASYASAVGDKVDAILVDDGIQYLVELLNTEVRRTSKKVVGITGSTGKSTTSELVMHALGATQTYKHLSDRPTPISIPIRALNSQSFYEAKYMVVEMPMDGLGQITELCQITPPQVGVILNINSSHLQQLGSMQNIVTAKMELVWQVLSNQGVVILNGDDPYLNVQARNLQRRELSAITFGQTPMNDIRIVSKEWNGAGYNFTFGNMGRVEMISTQFIGETLAHSFGAAIGAAMASGVSFVEAINNLGTAKPLPSRMSVLHGQKGETIIDDTRLATPQSSIHFLETVLNVPVARKVLVQGPILREYQHGTVTDDLVGVMSQFDEVLLYQDDSWLPDGVEFPLYTDENAILDMYRKVVQKGDLVVVNGSEGLQMWNMVKHLVITADVEKIYDPNT